MIEILQRDSGQITEFPEDLYSAVESNSHSFTVLVVPSEWTANTAEPLPDVPTDTWHVTEWWIERCIVAKTIVNPAIDVYSRPRLNLTNDCTSWYGAVLHFSNMLKCSSAWSLAQRGWVTM